VLTAAALAVVLAAVYLTLLAVLWHCLTHNRRNHR
jgi:hypothetical protein